MLTVERVSPGRWRVSGVATVADARELAESLSADASEPAATLLLEGLELASGAACAAMVDVVRVFVSRGVTPTLVGPPQALAHVLYRVGLAGRVTLEDVAEDLPYAP